MNIDVLVSDQKATALVERLSRRLQDGTPALYGLVDSLLEVERERFSGRGVRWKKLKPETRRLDAQQGRDPRPLVLSGELMASLTQRGAPGQFVRVTPTTLRFGTRVPQARFQKKLGRNPAGTTRVQRKALAAELKALLLEDR